MHRSYTGFMPGVAGRLWLGFCFIVGCAPLAKNAQLAHSSSRPMAAVVRKSSVDSSEKDEVPPATIAIKSHVREESAFSSLHFLEGCWRYRRREISRHVVFRGCVRGSNPADFYIEPVEWSQELRWKRGRKGWHGVLFRSGAGTNRRFDWVIQWDEGLSELYMLELVGRRKLYGKTKSLRYQLVSQGKHMLRFEFEGKVLFMQMLSSGEEQILLLSLGSHPYELVRQPCVDRTLPAFD